MHAVMNSDSVAASIPDTSSQGKWNLLIFQDLYDMSTRWLEHIWTDLKAHHGNNGSNGIEM